MSSAAEAKVLRYFTHLADEEKGWKNPDLSTDVLARTLLQAVVQLTEKADVDRSRSVDSVVRLDPNSRKIFIDSRFPRIFLTSEGFEVPIDGFIILHQTVKRALIRRARLSEEYAEEIGIRAEREAVRAARLSWSEYRKFIVKHSTQIARSRHFYDRDDLSTKRMLDAVEEIFNSARIDHSYWIPYGAGYNHSGRVLYIDRMIPQSFLRPDGKRVHIFPALILHERIEKSLKLDGLLGYLYPHQIAQRIEHSIHRALGIPTSAYEKKITSIILARMSSEISDVAPADLDLTPYEAFRDAESKRLLQKLRAYQKKR